MLSHKVMEPAQTEWAARIVFALKKDGSICFCVDYRKLNAVTKRDSYAIPRMDECIHSLGEVEVFPTLDTDIVYW